MRNRTASSFSAIVTLVVFGAVAFAYAATPGLTVKNVTENVYLVQGGVSNSTIIIGQDGVIVVDAENRQSDGQQLVAEIGDPLKNSSRFPSFTETTYQELSRK